MYMKGGMLFCMLCLDTFVAVIQVKNYVVNEKAVEFMLTSLATPSDSDGMSNRHGTLVCEARGRKQTLQKHFAHQQT